MKCPFTKVKGRVCSRTDCVFSSKVNDSGCYFGEKVDIQNIARHKNLSVRQVKAELAETEDNIHYVIKLFKYAEFCKDETPTERDNLFYEALHVVKPYNTTLFRFVTLNRFARMNRSEAFEAFKSTGVVIEESLSEFLSKPITK